jgi:hypothetical protein
MTVSYLLIVLTFVFLSMVENFTHTSGSLIQLFGMKQPYLSSMVSLFGSVVPMSLDYGMIYQSSGMDRCQS